MRNRTAALLLCLVLVSALQAQRTVGSIAGTVRDSSGAVVPGVNITLTSPALIGGARTISSDAGGYFKFLDLQPGEYTLKYEKSGFKTLSESGIEISSGFQATVNPVLQVGQVTETVIVSGEAPLIDTTNVTNQSVLNQDLMERIPTGRDPWVLARLTPGVNPGRYDVGGTEGMQQYNLTIHGSRDGDKKFAIDGVEVNWSGGSGGATSIYYDMGSFREVNLQTGALPAEVSQGGVLINMVTKDGGNDIHGSGLFYYANDAMQATNVTPALKNILLSRIPADRRAQYRAGNAIDEVYDLNLNAGGPFIKDKLWWFVSYRRWKVDQLAAGGNSLNPDGRQPIDDNLIWNVVGKTSWQINNKNRLSLLYDRNYKFRYHRRDVPPFFIDDSASWLQDMPSYSGNITWTYTPTAKAVLNTGVAYMHSVFPLRYQPSVKPTDLTRDDSTLSTRTGAAIYNYTNPNYRLSIDPTLSYTTSGWGGSHTLKTGIQVTRAFFRQTYNMNGDIRLLFTNGRPTNVLLFNTPVDQQSFIHGLAWFAQDSWTIARKLTLNFGLRFERLLGVIPAQRSPAGTYVPARQFNEIRDVPNFKNWSPRFGLAYDFTGRGRTVLKASASRYLQNIAMGLTANNLNPLALLNVNRIWNDANGDQLPQPSEIAAGALPSATLPRLAPGVDRPYSWEYSLGIQHELYKGIVFSASGWHRDWRQQLGRSNAAVSPSAYSPINILRSDGVPLTFYNQDPTTRTLVDNVIGNHSALDSGYNGVDFIFTKRFANRWQLLSAWTIGKEYGASRGDFVLGFDDLNNPNQNINRRGIVGDDTTHVFKLAGTVRLPWNFEFSGNFQHATGYPLRRTYTVTANDRDAATGVALGTRLTASQTIDVVPRGQFRLPNVNLLDLRFSRIFKVGDRWSVQPTLDIYNIGNINTHTSQVQAIGASLGQPGALIAPRLWKLGVKVDF